MSPASATTQANPSSGRWNYGREIAVNFAESGDFNVTFVFSFLKSFCKYFAINLPLQSALQPLWVMACSTIAEYSQQEGFYRVPLPAARQTPPTWRTSVLERSNSRHKVSSASEMTQTNPRSEKLPRILPKVATSTSLLGSFTYCKLRHGTDGFTSPPKEGALRIFSPEKSDGFR